MSHLEEQISDLVDGRLAGVAAAHVNAHLAGCSACRHLVDSERLTKERLWVLADPEPPPGLSARLLALPQTLDEAGADRGAARAAGAGSGPVPGTAPPGSRRPGGSSRPPSAPAGGPHPVPLPDGRGRLAGRPQRLRVAAAVAGSVGAVSAGLFGLSVVSPAANAALVPSVDLLAPRSVVSTSLLPVLSMPPAWWVAADVSRR